MTKNSGQRSPTYWVLSLTLMSLLSFLLSACSAPPAEAVEAGIPVQDLQFSAPVGLPNRIVLPAIDLDTPVVELGWSSRNGKAGQVFSEWDVADFAAGWHKNSARPGYGSNVVLSGHNNIKGAVFRELDQLRRGDTALLYVGDQVYTYAVDDVLIVPEKYATPEQRRQNAAWIAPTTEERLTLVSCWPRDDNSHRIIVVASPVKNDTAAGP